MHSVLLMETSGIESDFEVTKDLLATLELFETYQVQESG